MDYFVLIIIKLHLSLLRINQAVECCTAFIAFLFLQTRFIKKYAHLCLLLSEPGMHVATADSVAFSPCDMLLSVVSSLSASKGNHLNCSAICCGLGTPCIVLVGIQYVETRERKAGAVAGLFAGVMIGTAGFCPFFVLEAYWTNQFLSVFVC
jgi:hypothetical protein